MSSSDQNYQQSRQKLGTFFRTQSTLKIKVFKKFHFTSWFKKIPFWWWKMTLKVWILQSLRRLFIIMVGLRMTWFSEKMLISYKCIRGLMPNLIKKSWTVSRLDALLVAWKVKSWIQLLFLQNSALFLKFTLPVQLFRQQKNKPLLIYPSRCSRDS